jgi:histidyl-tRNA synthetase
MLQRPRGTRDLLPEDMDKRRQIEDIMRGTALCYSFKEVKTPMFEELELFTMKSGESIVKEIYDFKDKSGRDLALRPELTAAVIRLYANNMQDAPKPLKVFYFGECFRYERPQKGRYREFKQFGAEIIGGDEVATNIEIVALALEVLGSLGLRGQGVRIGYLDIMRSLFEDLGVEKAKQGPFMTLIDKGNLEGLEELMMEEGLEGEVAETILKVAAMKGDPEKVLLMARKMLKKWSKCIEGIEKLQAIVDGIGKSDIPGSGTIEVDLGIARGLDYYTGMVFEVDVPDLGAEKQVCGGGAYALTELFGLEPTNSTGFAMGIDRLLLALEKQGALEPMVGPLAYIIPFKGTEEKAMEIVWMLRGAGIPLDYDMSGRSLSKNLKYASSVNARYVVLIGTKELEKGVVTVRDMESGDQREIKVGDLTEHFLNEILNSENRA